MLKTRNDFNTEQEYRAYTKTSDFLLNYSWKGKTKEQVIYEMALPDYEQDYLEEAMEKLTKKDEFSGMALDNFILRRLDEDEEEEEFDPDEVLYIKRK
ncbi:hypothetical protein [Virgibacillus sp. Bac330]|uniref:hypothetical protein n=1 Tax=Virgibacillus sp. Bac330 TaxID=2419841 RepID=UPI000EF4EC45|nr:hypothetical protein [Virgibacillus sp. Bac330]